MWYAYILETRKGTFYTGITNNVARRLAEHAQGRGARYTRIYGVRELLYTEEFPSRGLALKREAQIKALSRASKIALIKSARGTLDAEGQGL
ncbi:MAG TPA: GIY-YIG nuclease family protein [Candidatus Omnitrophota bacterium]|nr:GIY-YIG nuclease family protein [Candidatus Omnitrophota bacterium]HPB68019.1 GIY-YIG nuclease family protein [Candidatus Omnitrophota bacterium]HQO57859.1 GIY-YIG nuclease family protein [Candidatus Omnitrophota bacterium]HQP11903.1 GIY-YIG nuclease family protein [Candidatus Omnitrophota bacterium]